MAATEENEVTDNPSVFGKGLRVRVTEGDDEGIVGEIVWWGKSKFGPGMRAGIQSEGDEEEKIWVEAAQMVAIDEDGNELDPQPAIEDTTPDVQAKETRVITVPYDLARAMTALRIQRGYPESKAASATLRLDRLNQAEQELGCTIPDAFVAYIASGVGTLREPSGIGELTLRLYDRRSEDVELEEAPLLAFDYHDSDYLAFSRGDERDTITLERLAKDEEYQDGESHDLKDWLTDQLEEKMTSAIQPFEVIIDFLTEDEPEPEFEEDWVTHSKFGRGVVLAREATMKGEKLTIRFDGGEVRKLLDRFVDFD